MSSFILEGGAKKNNGPLVFRYFAIDALDAAYFTIIVKRNLPLTVSLVEHSALPIAFSATILYSPVSFGPTLSMSREHTPQVLVTW